MTAFRDLKRIIRERQSKTGESYTAARVHVLRERAALLGAAPAQSAASEPERVEAVVLKVNRQSARVRIPGESGQLTFRSGRIWHLAPGHLVTLAIDKRWTWKGDPYASGRAENPRIAVEQLGLEPLPLHGGELVNLRSGYEPFRRPDPYAPMWRSLTARPRPDFEMDPIAWGEFPDVDFEDNLTCEAAELAGAGDIDDAGIRRQLARDDMRNVRQAGRTGGERLPEPDEELPGVTEFRLFAPPGRRGVSRGRHAPPGPPQPAPSAR